MKTRALVRLFEMFIDVPAKWAAHELEGALVVNAGVPDLDMAHVAVLPHVLAIRLNTIQDRPPVRRGREAVRAPGDHAAGGRALCIPLPWTVEGLVEIIDHE